MSQRAYTVQESVNTFKLDLLMAMEVIEELYGITGVPTVMEYVGLGDYNSLKRFKLRYYGQHTDPDLVAEPVVPVIITLELDEQNKLTSIETDEEVMLKVNVPVNKVPMVEPNSYPISDTPVTQPVRQELSEAGLEVPVTRSLKATPSARGQYIVTGL